MHNNINLLDTIASSIGDFTRKTMKIVFTENELKTHILPPTRSYLARPGLDDKKFQIVNGMNDTLQTFYNEERLFNFFLRSCSYQIQTGLDEISSIF